MVAKTFGGVPKQRKVFRVTGASPPVDFGIHNNTLVNLLRGLRERVFCVESMVDGQRTLREPPQPAAGLVKERLAPFLQQLRRRTHPTTPYSTEQFVDCYTGRRRVVYQGAADTYTAFGVQRRHAYLSTFVKAEKINFSSKPDPAPRVIQPRHPVYNVAVGRYLKRIEHPLYRMVNDIFGEVTIMKGHNAASSGSVMAEKWESFRSPVAVGLDASRFDQHVSSDALRWEHQVYLGFFRGADREELARLLDWQIKNKGFGRASDGEARYTVEGSRMSGDMNTGLGNCLLMCAMIYCYMRAKNIPYSLANNGDDCVLFMEKDHLSLIQDLPDWFLEIGFTMKMESPVYDLEAVEFCQTHPVWTPQGWVMVRKHRTAMAKDCVSVVDLQHPRVLRRWMGAVGGAGLSLTGGIPVQQEFYQMFLRHGLDPLEHPFLESGFFRLAQGMTRYYGPIDAKTRYSYWLAFGVLPDEQIVIENALAIRSLYLGPADPSGDPIAPLPFSLNNFLYL